MEYKSKAQKYISHKIRLLELNILTSTLEWRRFIPPPPPPIDEVGPAALSEVPHLGNTAVYTLTRGVGPIQKFPVRYFCFKSNCNHPRVSLVIEVRALLPKYT